MDEQAPRIARRSLLASGAAAAGAAVAGAAVAAMAMAPATRAATGDTMYVGNAHQAAGRTSVNCWHASNDALAGFGVGALIMAKNTRSKTVNVGFEISTASRVFATLASDPGGATCVRRVAVHTGSDSFTVYLTANATKTVRVHWLAIG